jgi:hypothetical protein
LRHRGDQIDVKLTTSGFADSSPMPAGRNSASGAELGSMAGTLRDMLDLELGLLRRGLDERLAGSERCSYCRRTPLVGEHVYVYESGTTACELCRGAQRDAPVRARMVHGPEFGHTIRVIDQRAA